MPKSAASVFLRLFASQHIYLIEDIYTKRMSKTCSIGLSGHFRNDTGSVPDASSRTENGLAIDRSSPRSRLSLRGFAVDGVRWQATF